MYSLGNSKCNLFLATKDQITKSKFLTEKPRNKRKIQSRPSEPWHRHHRASRYAGETRRLSSIRMDWEDPPDDKEVDAPRCVSTSTLHDEHRHQLGHLQPHLRDLQTPGPPTLGHRPGGTALRSSDEPQPRKGQQDRHGAPPEQPERRRRLLPTKSTPMTPPSPQRRRLQLQYSLHYVHDVIRRSPILPPPGRPPEGEESVGSTPARWKQRRLSKSPRSTVDGERGPVQLGVFFEHTDYMFLKIVHSRTCRWNTWYVMLI